jgi:hypothetical protein
LNRDHGADAAAFQRTPTSGSDSHCRSGQRAPNPDRPTHRSMPITLSYDVTALDNNARNYIRSMFERFHWRRIGGSVFRYDGVPTEEGRYEDWLNHVAPSLMFFRSFIRAKKIRLNAFTLDASSASFLDQSDPEALLGVAPSAASDLDLAEPTNVQSSESKLRDFVQAAEVSAI